jgi:uncharacterized C2H2 Zn-finger protein
MAHQELTCPHCDYSTPKRFNLNRHIVAVHSFHLEENSRNSQKVPADSQKVPADSQKVPENSQKVPADSQKVPENSPNVLHEHQCEKCEKLYANANSLRVHKKKCNGKLNPLQCPTCHMIFANKKTKYNHKSQCQGAQLPVTHTIDTQNNYNQCTINNVHNTQNNNNNININIMNFNQENLDYITHEFARSCFDSGVHGVNPMIDKIYFNEEHPENHNVQLVSLNHGVVEVYKNNKWIADAIVNVIDRMISHSTGTMLLKIQHDKLDPENDLPNLAAIQNIAPEHKKKIRDHTKCKLIARRNDSNNS